MHDSLKEADVAWSSFSEQAADEAGEQDPEGALARLAPILKYIGSLLGAADPALVSPAMLDNLNAPLQQIASALVALRDNKEFAVIPTIQANAEGVLTAAVQIAPALGVWTKTDLSEAASNLGEAATAKTRQLKRQTTTLDGRLKEIAEQTNEAFNNLKTETESGSTQMRADLNALKTEVDDQRSQVQAAIGNFQIQFNSEQEKRDQQFGEFSKGLSDQGQQKIEELQAANEAATAEERDRTNAAVTQLEERGEEIVETLSKKRAEAEDLLDLVSTSATAGAFGKEATEQRAQADSWRKNAIGISLVAGVLAVITVLLSFFYNASTTELIAKVAAITVLLGVAGYAAGQSGQHRRREQRAKRLELELVAFGPFTEPLDPDERKEVRRDLIERLFVGDPGDDEHGPSPKPSEEQLTTLARVVELLPVNHGRK